MWLNAYASLASQFWALSSDSQFDGSAGEFTRGYLRGDPDWFWRITFAFVTHDSLPLFMVVPSIPPKPTGRLHNFAVCLLSDESSRHSYSRNADIASDGNVRVGPLVGRYTEGRRSVWTPRRL
jgi:hypothetical protein